MELRQIQHFLAVVDLGNFHRAAEKVNLTQQAVSKSVRQLENQLGVRLLDRNRQSVSPTPFGELLLPHARAVDSEIRQFMRSLNAQLGIDQDVVRIGATPTPIQELLPKAIQRTLNRRPKQRFHIERGHFDRLARSLLSGDVDIVVSTEPESKPDPLIEMEELLQDTNVVIVRRGHPLSAKASVKPLDLLDYSWITIVNLEKAEVELKRIFKDPKLKSPVPTIVSGSIVFAVNWLLETEFISILPRRLVSREIDNGRLVELPVAAPHPTWPIVLAYRRNSTRSAATLALIDDLRAAAIGLVK